MLFANCIAVDYEDALPLPLVQRLRDVLFSVFALAS